MKANLEGCRERVAGAEEDFNALKDEMVAAIKSHGDAIHLDLKDQIKHKRSVIYVDKAMAFPRVWDRRAAHVLYDVRSALDHLVHELYVASKGKRPLKDVAGRLQFPMCDTKGAWAAALRSSPRRPNNVEGLDARFIDIIRRHQPCFSKAKTRHVLSQLRRFSDLDKHRRPNVVLFAAEHAEIGIRVPDPVTARIELIGLRRALKVGTELAHVYFSSPVPHAPGGKIRVDMGIKGRLYPSFARGVQLEVLLAYAILEARAIISECAAAL